MERFNYAAARAHRYDNPGDLRKFLNLDADAIQKELLSRQSSDASEDTASDKSADVRDSDIGIHDDIAEEVKDQEIVEEVPGKASEEVSEDVPEEKSILSGFEKFNDDFSVDSFKHDITSFSSGNNDNDNIQVVPPPVQSEPDQPDEEVAAVVQKDREVDRQTQIRRARARSTDKIKTSCLRNVPTDLVKLIQEMFKTGSDSLPMDVAVSAYLYIKENYPENVVLTEKISEALELFDDKSVSNSDLQSLLKQEMLHLRKQNDDLRAENRRLTEKLDTIETALLYIIFDNAGFRKKEQFSPGEVDFLEIGMEELRSRLNKQAADRRERIRHRDGSSHNFG